MSARDFLAAVQQRADAATDGPWITEGTHVVHPPWEADDDTYWVADAFEEGPNVDFIAASRTDVPRLVAALAAVLDLADSVTQHDELGHREWGDVPGWKVREVITDALTPKENDRG